MSEYPDHLCRKGGPQTSDGYHTFAELYDHRYTLFLALCRYIYKSEPHRIWRSKRHNDNTWYPGNFIAGIDMAPGEQITYHLPEKLWHKLDFALTLERAPPFDGHKPQDVLKRLDEL